MSLVKDSCLCLRKTEYSETSQILTLLSRNHGLLRVIAKGAHRTTKAGASKFGGGLYLAQYAAELVSLLIEEHDPHPNLFDHLQNCLQALSTPALEQSFLAFEIELLRETGYLPDLRECTSCGTRSLTNTSRISFSPDRGGVLCNNCEPRFPQRLTLDARLLGIMQQFVIANGSPRRLPILTRHQTDPINKLLAEYIEHTLGRRLRLSKYVIAK